MIRLTKKALDGNVETIILAELVAGANYGYALVKAINDKHEGLLALGEGTIYPVLYRMEEKGLLSSEVQKSSSGRKRKYYQVSKEGKHSLAENMSQWDALSKVMEKIEQGLPERKKLQNGTA
jgi:PadR family transcriptional regulator